MIKVPSFVGFEPREKVIARWEGILADPHAIPTAKRMAQEALAQLHFGRAAAEEVRRTAAGNKFSNDEYSRVEAVRGMIDREPGED